MVWNKNWRYVLVGVGVQAGTKTHHYLWELRFCCEGDHFGTIAQTQLYAYLIIVLVHRENKHGGGKEMC